MCSPRSTRLPSGKFLVPPIDQNDLESLLKMGSSTLNFPDMEGRWKDRGGSQQRESCSDWSRVPMRAEKQSQD